MLTSLSLTIFHGKMVVTIQAILKFCYKQSKLQKQSPILTP